MRRESTEARFRTRMTTTTTTTEKTDAVRQKGQNNLNIVDRYEGMPIKIKHRDLLPAVNFISCPIANIRGRWRITKAKMVPRSITIHNYATERQRQTKRLGKRMKTRWKLRSLKARHCSTPAIYDSESKPGTAEKEIPLYGTHKAREFNNLIIKKLIIINTNNQMSVNRGENRSKYRYSVKK